MLTTCSIVDDLRGQRHPEAVPVYSYDTVTVTSCGFHELNEHLVYEYPQYPSAVGDSHGTALHVRFVCRSLTGYRLGVICMVYLDPLGLYEPVAPDIEQNLLKAPTLHSHDLLSSVCLLRWSTLSPIPLIKIMPVSSRIALLPTANRSRRRHRSSIHQERVAGILRVIH